MVSDQVLQPTYTRDLAAALVDAVERDATGIAPPHRRGRGLVVRVHPGDHGERRPVRRPLDPVTTTIPEGGVDRPLNGVLARPRADELGIPKLRSWREALDDYMSRAGLAA